MAQAVFTLLFVSFVVFWMARLTGSPLDLLMPLGASKADFARAQASLGLDRPWYAQYALFLEDVARGNLGNSVRTGEPVRTLIAQRFPNSMLLAGASVTLATAVSIPLGVAAAVHRGGPTDSFARIFALVGQAIPSFWLGVLLVLFFAVNLRLLPTSGTGGVAHLVLPCVTLAFLISAGLVRIVRAAMLEALTSEFIQVARAKGLPERVVIWRHAFRNALLPTVTFLGLTLTLITAAAVVVETVFVWPGLGRLAYDAVTWRDYPLIQGVVLVWVGMVVVINFVVDGACVMLDPRVRASE